MSKFIVLVVVCKGILSRPAWLAAWVIHSVRVSIPDEFESHSNSILVGRDAASIAGKRGALSSR